MPGQLTYNNSTFNRTNQSGISSGFYSRTLFSYHTVNNDEYNLSNDWTENEGFDGITWLQNNIPERCHGSNILPPYYWRPGKNIRIRGTFFVGSTNQNCIFNMRFGIKKVGDVLIPLAIQNNGFNHYFNYTYNTKPNEEEEAKFLPINFLCDIMCGVINDVGDFKIEGGGYYQYCWRRFDGELPAYGFSNIDNVYVPLLFHNRGYTFRLISDSHYYEATSLEMNIFGSTVDKCYIRNLTIEELA
jgi:hypothetical protein